MVDKMVDKMVALMVALTDFELADYLVEWKEPC
jgi:hypothetical protein